VSNNLNIFTFNMPDIGEGVVEGEVVSWLKKEGDSLKKDEPVLILMTDKATVELPTPHPGILKKLYYQPGQIAQKDHPLFDVEVEDVLPKKQEAKQEEAVPQTVKKGVVASAKVQAAPPVRKLAKDLGISLEGIQGSGQKGRILKGDLMQRGANSQTPLWHLSGDSETPLIGIKNLMAKKMSESHAVIPPFSYFGKADATRLLQMQEKMGQEALKQGVKLTLTPFFVRALSLVLKEFPSANSSLDTQTNHLIIHAQHNMGIAMTTPLGLIVPVLKGVEKLPLPELVLAFEALKEKAKTNHLAPSDMKEATITLSNVGALPGGGTYATPVINPPEAAILALARIQKEPAAFHDEVVLRDVLYCSWSFDHRIIDGDMASRISAAFNKLIENPAGLL
jgi:pyruvate dehydrogenase E2 component (dihydrolipoamide acetyltransferase)